MAAVESISTYSSSKPDASPSIFMYSATRLICSPVYLDLLSESSANANISSFWLLFISSELEIMFLNISEFLATIKYATNDRIHIVRTHGKMVNNI